jgi:hypothetical protein
MLMHDDVLLLNPNFGASSRIVRGADADLIAGDMLVDFKATKKERMDERDLDQLLGYYFLARHERDLDQTFPAINRLGLYFARYGCLWVQDTRVWTDQAQFAETEEWFFAHAVRVRLKRPNITINRERQPTKND